MSLIVKNKKAYFEYFIIEEYDAGIMLKGSEVKSIRNSNISFNDSYIYINKNEVWLKNFKIARYKQAHFAVAHDENRDKKLLLTKKQIKNISKYLQDKGMTCVPLSVFLMNNKIKIRIGVVKGKKLWDRRNKIKENDNKRQTERDLNII